MSPLPQDPAPAAPRQVSAEDEVVISGMAALMPGCRDMLDFTDKLYGKINLTKCGKSRWDFGHPELPPHMGKVPGLDRFDSQFFMVNTRLAHFTDVMSRKLLELSYEALYDAGVPAVELNGRRVGVFIATAYSESEKFCSFQSGNQGIAGCNRAMFANRISYWLNSNGPSLTLDCNSCGSIVALEQAQQAILSGRCESALVGGCRVLLHPQSVIHYGRQGQLNETGVAKSYDTNADGETLSDGINMIYIQKRKDARRIYATIAHVKTGYNGVINSEDHLEYTPLREPESFEIFLKEFYKEAGVPASIVDYVEGFGSALPRSDKAELELIDKIFTKGRNKPLLVGTVMSNIGNTEAASGTSSLIKLLLSYQKGVIAGNINCDEPRRDVAGVNEGRLKIVTDDQQFDRSYTALNTFSIIGAHGHVLLKGDYIHRDPSKYQTDIPYILAVAGRHERAVRRILNWVKYRPINAEEIALLNLLHKYSNSKHLSRGFGVYKPGENETTLLHQEVAFCDIGKRTLWFVYSGMGSQWVGMGTQLMRIPIFAAAVKRCDEVLAPLGVDIVKILTTTEKSIFDNILHSFIGIATVQIGITDILKALGIVPDFIIGHSVGELGCAYADGCVTAEEMILLAYYRGLVSIQTKFIYGSMAAVGMGYKQISKILPPEIEVACHNGPDSSTISGPATIMKTFVDDLASKGTFAKEVACSNIAYHSKYIASAGPKLLEYFKKVIISPTLRSNRWLSTSVPQDQWGEPLAKYSSAEYHVNNLLNPVLFEETCQNIPHNAVLIEIAPHGLLQAILKRSLPPDCDYIPLTNRSNADNAVFLIKAIGKVYMKGYDVDVSILNPKVEYPVSTETSVLSHLVEWDHSEKWTVCYYVAPTRLRTACYKPIITIYDEEYHYLDGYRVQGKRTFPYTAALLYVWDTLAMSLNKKKNNLSVQFQNIHFYSQPTLLDYNSLHLRIEVHKGSGRFEVLSEQGIIVDGFIVNKEIIYPKCELENKNEPTNLTNIDVYNILSEKGYDFRDAFRPIQKANKSFTRAEIAWTGNWVTLIEGMIQMKALSEGFDDICKLEHINRLSINVKTHFKENEPHLQSRLIESQFYKLHDLIQCGGVTLENVSFKHIPKQILQKPVLKSHKFIPFFQSENSDERTYLYCLMQIISENIGKTNITVLNCGNTESTILDKIDNLLNTPPFIKVKIIQLDANVMKLKKIEKPDIVIVDQYQQSEKNIFEAFYNFLPSDTFLITTGVNIEGTYPRSLYKPVASMGLRNQKLELAIWRPTLPTSTSAISVKSLSDLKLLRSTHVNLPPQHKLLIFTSYPPIPGLKDIVKELRSGRGCQNVCAVLTDQQGFKDNSEDMTSFELAINVLSQGTWGGEYYVPNTECNLTTSRYVTLQSLNPGDINSVSWVKMPQDEKSGVPVVVHFAGLNVYDAKRATGVVSSSKNEGFGMDFSGVTERGTRVMGIIETGAASTIVRADPRLLWPVPDHWSLEDAATVPLPYFLAFYCLRYQVDISRGDSVLIHGGAGGLGLAAISIALAQGCTVFTTVSDVHKKRFLRQLYPDLPADHIGNSRDETFCDMVLTKTRGQGCKVILSCVRGELKKFTLNCGCLSATTIDTLQIHERENYDYGMFAMTKDRSYKAIDFISIFKNQDHEVLQHLHSLVSAGIVSGCVGPLPRASLPATQAVRALRLLAASKHRGRLLLQVNSVPRVTAVPRFQCSPDRHQLILCDNEDFGLQLADKLIKHGAKKLLLYYSKTTPYMDYKLRTWKDYGVQVNLWSSILDDKKSVHSFLEEGRHLGVAEGIYVVASKDEVRVNNLVANVDVASREIFAFLKYFTVISQDHFVGYDVHLQRISNGFPSVFIQLHHLMEFESYAEPNEENKLNLSPQAALDGITEALCSDNSAVLVYGETVAPVNILEEVAKVAGRKVSWLEVDDSTKLVELGVDEDRAAILQKQLVRKFGIVLPQARIPNIKISELKQLQASSATPLAPTAGVAGVGAALEGCFGFVDADEIRASCDVMPLQTLAQTAKLRPEEFDMDSTYLYVVPGVEGSYKRFRALAERLLLPAAVLQPGLNAREDAELPERLVQVMHKKLILKEHFYLLGYEYGVTIALKMAAILEKSGLTGTVYCLGGTPENISQIFMSQLKFDDVKELQNTIIHHVFNKLCENEDKTNFLKDVTEDDDDDDDGSNKVKEYNEELTKKLKTVDTWQEKVDVFVSLIKSKTTHTHQYVRAVLETFYAKVQELLHAKTEPVHLKSKVIFLCPKMAQKSYDFKLFSDNFEVHYLDSNLASMTKDLQVTTFINKHLSKEILENYKNSNHCETEIRCDDLFSGFKGEGLDQETENE